MMGLGYVPYILNNQLLKLVTYPKRLNSTQSTKNRKGEKGKKKQIGQIARGKEQMEYTRKQMVPMIKSKLE